jgi:hypothetical protein
LIAPPYAQEKLAVAALEALPTKTQRVLLRRRPLMKMFEKLEHLRHDSLQAR